MELQLATNLALLLVKKTLSRLMGLHGGAVSRDEFGDRDAETLPGARALTDFIH